MHLVHATLDERKIRYLALHVALVASAVLSVRSAAAATYQVGPSRSHKQLAEVAPLLAPGDVVEVDGNATYTGDVEFKKAGTAAQPITIRGIPVNGKRPVISGGTYTVALKGDNTIFQSFEVTGGSGVCILHNADGITVRDAVVHGCPTHGLMGTDSNAGSLTLEYSEFYNNSSGGSDRHHQIYMVTDQAVHPHATFRMQYCYVHDGAGGINVKSRAERNEIFYNWIGGAIYHELDLIGLDGTTTSRPMHSEVIGNVFVKSPSSTWFIAALGNDAGGAGPGDTLGYDRFVNNTIVMGAQSTLALRVAGTIAGLEIDNNIFYQPSGSARLLSIRDAAWVSGSPTIVGSNNWIGGVSWTDVPSQLTGSLTGVSPGFEGFSSLDLRLTASSPLIHAGTANPPSSITSALAVAGSYPPVRQLMAVGTAVGRSNAGGVTIGAFDQIGVAPGVSTPPSTTPPSTTPPSTTGNGTTASAGGHLGTTTQAPGGSGVIPTAQSVSNAPTTSPSSNGSSPSTNTDGATPAPVSNGAGSDPITNGGVTPAAVTGASPKIGHNSTSTASTDIQGTQVDEGSGTVQGGVGCSVPSSPASPHNPVWIGAAAAACVLRLRRTKRK